MSQDETLRLVAELLDKTSGPLKDIQKSLRDTRDVAKKLHSDGTDGAKEHEKAQSKLHESIARTRRELAGSLTPAMAALGLSTFGVGEAIGKVIESLKEMGAQYNFMNDISKRAGMSVDAVRQLSIAFERLGIDQGRATQSAAEFGEHMDKLQRGTNSEENLAWATKLGGAYQALGDTLKHTPTRSGQLDAIFTFFSSHPNIPVDQKRKFYEELLHLPPELATKTGEELREALAAGLKYVTDHPANLALGKELNKSFSDLRETLRGINDDMVEAFGGDGATLVLKLSDAINHNVADIKQMSEDWMALVDKVGRGLGFRSGDPNDPAQKKWDEEHSNLKPYIPPNTKFAPPRSNSPFPGGTYHPTSFTSGGGDPEDMLAKGVKTGMLAAFREWFAATSSKGGGYQNASYEPGGGGGGGDNTPIGRAVREAIHGKAGGDPSVDGSGDAPGHSGETIGEAGGSGINRDKWLAQLEANPRLKEELFRRAIGENDNPMANQAVMEEAANRADIRGNKGFADHSNLSYFQGHRGFSRTERAMMERNFDKVFRQGSDVAGGAIDNSSQWLSAKHERNGRFHTVVNYGGDRVTGHRGVESFEVPGWGESGAGEKARWPGYRANQLAEAQRRREAQMHTVKGDASLGITLNGFPKGTKTDLTYGGLFTSYNLSRGRQMEASEQK
jgi:hypothetical protein